MTERLHGRICGCRENEKIMPRGAVAVYIMYEGTGRCIKNSQKVLHERGFIYLCVRTNGGHPCFTYFKSYKFNTIYDR
ncbi:MAG: hypothetical protein DBY24_00845 [Prevotellaceae bacterium]|nr:MAG: hypothetical protein DBY24_00845 [Prevotellaceae bacterium]